MNSNCLSDLRAWQLIMTTCVDQQKVIVVLLSLVCCSLSIALAPATVGEIAASTGQLSNRLKVCTECMFVFLYCGWVKDFLDNGNIN